jgi:hypothetical protein
MKNSRNSIVYRGATQVRKSLSSASNRRSISKTYRGSTYKTLSTEQQAPSKHTYRGVDFVA